MSINDILHSARTGLAATQAALGTVSNNIANVGTPGYARERISLSTGVVAGRVAGVIVGEPTRVADRFLEDMVYRRSADTGRYDAESTYLDRMQALLGTPGAEGGIPARMDAISAAAIAITGLPNSPQTVAAFTSQVGDAVNSLQQMGRDTVQLRVDVETEIGFSVEQANGLLARIHDLNDTIARLQGLGRTTSGVEDQRTMAIEELSGLMDIDVRYQPDGRVAIDGPGDTILLDRRLRQIHYPMPGEGVAQTSYPDMTIRFADNGGTAGLDTGERLNGAATGGKLGGLINIRDNVIPQFVDQLGILFGGMAETLNSASNAATSVPPPASLSGRATGLVGSDRLGFTGAAQFAVNDSAGRMIAATTLDFDAMGAGATIGDAVAAINAGLGGAGTVTLAADGSLSFAAAAAGHGVAVGQIAANPSDRGGAGFSQFFGLNDLIRTSGSALTPSGLSANDPHGFGAGESAQIELRDATGRIIAAHTLTGSAGSTMGDLVTELNAGAVGRYGQFTLQSNGRIAFAADPAIAGTAISIPSDSTNRFGTGRSFTSLSGLTGGWADMAQARVRPELAGNPAHMPLALLQEGKAAGEKMLGSGDVGGASLLVDALSATRDFAGRGQTNVARFTAALMGGLGTASSLADDRLADATARRNDAVNRRDSFSGVNLDEELAQMIVLQNSYSAAARVMTTASQMYDTLIEMMR